MVCKLLSKQFLALLNLEIFLNFFLDIVASLKLPRLLIMTKNHQKMALAKGQSPSTRAQNLARVAGRTFQFIPYKFRIVLVQYFTSTVLYYCSIVLMFWCSIVLVLQRTSALLYQYSIVQGQCCTSALEYCTSALQCCTLTVRQKYKRIRGAGLGHGTISCLPESAGPASTYCTALHCTALHCTKIQYTALHLFKVLHCTNAMYCNVLQCTALHRARTQHFKSCIPKAILQETTLHK